MEKLKTAMRHLMASWKKVPKNIFVGMEVFEIGVSSAIINFNEGVCGIVGIFETLNLSPGFSHRFCSA